MNEMMLITTPRGEGGDSNYIFHGEVNDLIPYSDLSSYFNVTQGTLMSGTEINKWLHFTLDDKELYVSKVAIRNRISWNYLYSLGLVYGTDDNGRYPSGTFTNQYRTITLNGRLYKCRLLKGVDTDFFFLPNTYYVEGSHNSEWSRLFYPLVTDDSYLNSSYTGIKYPIYTNAELGMLSGDARLSWCQERPSAYANSRVRRGGESVTHLNWNEYSASSALFGWRACLEAV